MLISILFVLFFSGITFILGVIYGTRIADQNYAKKVVDQGLLSLDADIIMIRADKRISANERKEIDMQRGMIRIEWELTRQLSEHLLKADLIKKTVERLPTEDSIRNGRGADTLYTYEIHVIDPDEFS